VADPTTQNGAPSSSFNPLSTALSGLGLGASIYSGNPINVAGSGANFASNLGAPSSVTQPVSIGASAAGIGMSALTGNYINAGLGLLNLGGKSLGIPSYITQGAGLVGSIFTGNPIGTAVNGALVGKGLYNMATGLNYNGSWSPSQSQISSAEGIGDDELNQAFSGIDATLANNQNLISAGQSPVDVSSALADLSEPPSSADLGGLNPPAAQTVAQNYGGQTPLYQYDPNMNSPTAPAQYQGNYYGTAQQGAAQQAYAASIYSPASSVAAPVSSGASSSAPRQYMSSLGLYAG
jgi:hypothetical protein